MAIDDKSTYYDAGGLEVMEVLKAKLTPEQFQGFLLGNALKYGLRLNWKTPEDKARDIEKLAVYSQLLSDNLVPRVAALSEVAADAMAAVVPRREVFTTQAGWPQAPDPIDGAAPLGARIFMAPVGTDVTAGYINLQIQSGQWDEYESTPTYEHSPTTIFLTLDEDRMVTGITPLDPEGVPEPLCSYGVYLLPQALIIFDSFTLMVALLKSYDIITKQGRDHPNPPRI